MTTEKIIVSTTTSASIERAWEAFTNPEDITQWNFASDDWCCPRAAVDLRVGGTYKARMEAKDKSFGFDFKGAYEEVAPYKALTLAMSDGRRARTTFEAVGNGTKVTTVFDAEAQNSIEMQRSGWQAILDNFRRHVERWSEAIL
jgi:uncharacterized protein YndB with AHSA1/START domain